MNKLVFIKLGGSLITDKDKVSYARFEIIKDLAKEIKKISQQYKNISMIIATGAGSFGHPIAEKYKNNLEQGLSEIKNAVKMINQIVVDSLKKEGIRSESVEPSEIAEYKDGKIVKLFNGLIVQLLEKNIIPVFHADLVDDKTSGVSILSMDRFLVDVAIDMQNKGFTVARVIFCGTTDGVLSDKGQTVENINNQNFLSVQKYFFKNGQVDTSGGMHGKVKECLRLIDKKIPGCIINGQNEGNLTRAILSEDMIGTKISRD